MSISVSNLQFGRTFSELIIAWLIGTVTASMMYISSWGQLAEIHMAVADGLFWFGLLIFPLLLIAWPFLTLLRSTIRRNALGVVLGGAMFALSVLGLLQPETADPYSQPIYRILGATGMVWVVLVAADVFVLQRRRRDA